MRPPVRGLGGTHLAAVALALGAWVLSDRPALAQVGALAGQNPVASSGYGGPVHGGPGLAAGPYGPPPGIFGPGYPGFGLEYGDGRYCILRRGHFLGGLSARNWGGYVLGKECLDPYVADPYSDPRAFNVRPPYSAPVAGTVYSTAPWPGSHP